MVFPLFVKGLPEVSVSTPIAPTTDPTFDIRFQNIPGAEAQSHNRTEAASGAFRI
jgi:hypothetical protein